MVKETLPGTAWRDAHQLPLTEQPGQPGLAVGSTAEVGGEHLQQGQGLQTPVNHGPDPPTRVEVEPGHEAEVVHTDGTVVQPQVGNPESSSKSGD